MSSDQGDMFDGLFHPQTYAKKTAKKVPYTKRPFPQLYSGVLVRIGRDAMHRMQYDHAERGRTVFGDKLHSLFNEVQQYFIAHEIPLDEPIPRRALSPWCQKVSGRSRDRGLTQMCQMGLLEVLTPGEATAWRERNAE